MERGNERERSRSSLRRLTGIVSLVVLLLLPIIVSQFAIAEPGGPIFSVLSNSSRNASSAAQVNTSGGYIYTVSLNATTQNPRWKGFVGNVSGSLSLADATGARIYNWNATTSTSGEVYATRNGSTISWGSVRCANVSNIGNENTYLGLSNAADNLTSTFNQNTHDAIFIGVNQIQTNTCRSLFTFVNDAAQASNFQEILAEDPNGGKIIYITPLENSITGYNGATYDFQLILPENGTQGWAGQTPYYFYVELD